MLDLSFQVADRRLVLKIGASKKALRPLVVLKHAPTTGQPAGRTQSKDVLELFFFQFQIHLV
jgi:hypothetical protein